MVDTPAAGGERLRVMLGDAAGGFTQGADLDAGGSSARTWWSSTSMV